jgi:hypothetical protein
MAYKPRLKFKADANYPLALKNESLVLKRIAKNTYENFTDKTDLTDYIDEMYCPPTSDTYLQAICGCGQDYSYATKTAVPAMSVICSCGRKIIEYGV